ncbi:MAG: hypothetical protein ACRDKV_03660 [Solirubrobacterales bacterium]
MIDAGGDEGKASPARATAGAIVALVMLAAALSLWTLIPVAWLYVGSRLSETQFPSAGPYLVVLAGIVASIAVIAWFIAALNSLYVRITGTHTVAPIRPVWLRSARDTGPARAGTLLETVMVGSVLLAFVVAGLWFFLLAGSPLPNQ